MVWFSDTWQWYSKRAITRKKNELIKSIGVSLDYYHQMMFEDVYTIIVNADKYHYNKLFWRFYLDYYHHCNIYFMKLVKNSIDWEYYTKEHRLNLFRKHIGSLNTPFELPDDLVYELENKKSHEYVNVRMKRDKTIKVNKFTMEPLFK